MRCKAVRHFWILYILISFAQAQEGLFLRFSLGSGYMTEFSSINKSGYTIPAKNHAIGWGFDEKYALYLSDFGGLIKKSVGEYNYINLDALGLGFTFHTPLKINVSLAGAHGKVSFAHKWSEATGDFKGDGLALNLSVDKEWLLSKRWGIGIGPQVFFFKTKKTGYEFMNFSINGIIAFYLSPQR